MTNPASNPPRRVIPHLRWWIGGALFASTVINYIDRQTLSVLAPFLKTEYQWTNSDFALVVIAFRMAYAIGQTGAGRLLDRWGTRLGLLLAVCWFFITDWFAIYLVAKGFKLENTLLGFWVPFLAADLGNFFGGGLSSWLIRRGWRVLTARKLVIIVCGLAMTSIAATTLVSNFAVLIALFGVSTFAYAAWSTMALALPSDLYPSRTVASVSGLSGTGAGIGTIISTWLIGHMADRYSFEPILIGASLVPLLATWFVLFLVRDGKEGSAV